MLIAQLGILPAAAALPRTSYTYICAHDHDHDQQTRAGKVLHNVNAANVLRAPREAWPASQLCQPQLGVN